MSRDNVKEREERAWKRWGHLSARELRAKKYTYQLAHQMLDALATFASNMCFAYRGDVEDVEKVRSRKLEEER